MVCYWCLVVLVVGNSCEWSDFLGGSDSVFSDLWCAFASDSCCFCILLDFSVSEACLVGRSKLVSSVSVSMLIDAWQFPLSFPSCLYVSQDVRYEVLTVFWSSSSCWLLSEVFAMAELCPQQWVASFLCLRRAVQLRKTVTRLPAARSAKVTGYNLDWAVVRQFLAKGPVLWQFMHVTLSLTRPFLRSHQLCRYSGTSQHFI
jgi:hypothetical protein